MLEPKDYFISLAFGAAIAVISLMMDCRKSAPSPASKYIFTGVACSLTMMILKGVCS